MFKRKYLWAQLLLIALVCAFQACYKDLGNYSYTDINQVAIGNIDSSYSVLLGDKLTISPTLAFSKDNVGDTANYSYKWFAMNTGGVLPGDVRKDLDTTKDMDISVTLVPGNYKVYYQVTDKKDGVTFTATFRLKVSTSIYEGWLVLNDVNSSARLDMVSKINDTMHMITDVLATTGSELSLQGKPVDVYCYTYTPSTYGIYVSTDHSTDRIDPETFKWKSTYNLKYEVLGSIPSNFHADILSAVTSSNAYLYAQGNVYYYYYTYQINYGTPINIVNGESTTFKPAPFMATGRNSSLTATAILYDADKHRFVRNTNNAAYCIAMPEPTTPLFSYDNTGMDLVYMVATTYNGDDVFAVLKNASNKYYLARFSLNTAAQNYYDEITGTDIDKAEHFTVDPTYGYLFYSVGGKLYEYDFVSKTSKLMLDKGNSVISLIKYQKFFSSKYSPLAKELMVCSYDPAKAVDSNGSMEFYTVPGLNDDLALDTAYQGFGKIVSVSYRER